MCIESPSHSPLMLWDTTYEQESKKKTMPLRNLNKNDNRLVITVYTAYHVLSENTLLLPLVLY